MDFKLKYLKFCMEHTSINSFESNELPIQTYELDIYDSPGYSGDILFICFII